MRETINDPRATPAQRVAALRGLVESGLELPEFVEESNNHIHTCYSFSPYTPSMASLLGREAGLQVVGSVDHDSVAAAGEMRDSAAILGMGAVTGFELRVKLHSLADVAAGRAPFADRKLNNPDSVGVAYITVQGIPQQSRAIFDEFLTVVRQRRLERTRLMGQAANQILADVGAPQFDFDRDVIGGSQYATGGTVTERHLLFAMSNALIDGFGRGKPLLAGLASMGLQLSDQQRVMLGDETNPYLPYDLLGTLKSAYLERFYVQPTYLAEGGELPDARTVVELALNHGAMPCYAYLGDVSASPTGDKKAEKFEDEILTELFEELGSIGFPAVTFMPPRNTPEQLARISALASRLGLLEVSGVDINQPSQTFSCPQLRQPEFSHLNTSTWAMVAHETLSNFDPELGLLHPASPLADLPLAKRVAVLGAMGPRLVAGASPERIAAELKEYDRD